MRGGMKMNRMKNRTLVKGLACYVAVAFFVLIVAEKAHAGFSPSEVMVLSPVERAADLNKIQSLLETKVVTERLNQLGFNKEEIQTRLDRLTDQQLHQVALKVDQLKVGGDGGIVIGILIIVILVLLVIYLAKRI
jgi:hypothetical protein